MGENPLLKLGTFGQSVWLDYIRRQMIESGELKTSSMMTASRGLPPIRRFSKRPLPGAPTMTRPSAARSRPASP
jgi:hypothetical protein